MFYIYANGKLIYQPMDDSLMLLAPKLTLEMGKAGSLTFQIPPNNKYYATLAQLSTIITVEMDDTEIFRGRVLTNNRNFNNIRTVYCEGDLAYLVDSVQKAEKYEGKAHALFQKIIDAHNARVEPFKRFVVGDVTVENRDVLLAGKSDDITDADTGKFDYKQIAINSIADEWQSTFDFIERCLLDYTGGYLRTRRQNGTTYIDLLADYGSTAVQEIEFGKNMLDMTEEVSAEDIFTVLIPLGDENLTIESVNNGSDELVDAAAVARYGRIIKTHVFDSVNTPSTLLENGKRYLDSNVNVPLTLTVKAVDMHLVDPNASPIYVGDKVRVSSAPHELLDQLTCTKIEYDMENPANNTYTFGTPKQSLTERYRKDKTKDANHGGGGAGGAASVADDNAQKQLDEFFKAWINVDEETAHIDLGALYNKFEKSVKILESSCGISLDAPSSNINIQALRKEFDNMGDEVKQQSAYIDLINEELDSRIALVASQHQELASREDAHYSQLTISTNELESEVAANTEHLKTLDGQVTESKTNITQLSGDLQAQIKLEAEHKNTLDGQISSTKTAIETLADDLSSQIKLEAGHNASQTNKIAALEIRANDIETSITLKADKTTIDSKITKINGRLETDEANIASLQTDMANVETLIANKISAITLDSLMMKAASIKATVAITSGVSVSAPVIIASKSMLVCGKPVATEEYVTGKIPNLSGYATQQWVEDKKYLTGIPNTCNAGTGFYAPYIRASTAMSVNGNAVATQAWVKEQLLNYAKSDHSHSEYASAGHTHAWASITGKPSSFTPAAHKHKIPTIVISNGHTHTVTVGSSTYTTGGVSTNALHKIEKKYTENN